MQRLLAGRKTNREHVIRVPVPSYRRSAFKAISEGVQSGHGHSGADKVEPASGKSAAQNASQRLLSAGKRLIAGSRLLRTLCGRAQPS